MYDIIRYEKIYNEVPLYDLMEFMDLDNEDTFKETDKRIDEEKGFKEALEKAKKYGRE